MEFRKKQPNKYNQFLTVMRKFRDGIINAEDVVEEVAVLFREDSDLWPEFITSVPGNRPTCMTTWMSEKIKALKGQVKHAQNSLLCTICCEQERNVVCFPCAHLAMCNKCQERLERPDTCPICNVPGAVTYTERIHMA